MGWLARDIRVNKRLERETLDWADGRARPEARSVAEDVTIVRPFSRSGRSCFERKVELRAAASEVPPCRGLRVVVGILVAPVPYAVIVPDETRLRVVVEAVVGGCAKSVRRFPLPCEADARGRRADRIGVGTGLVGGGVGPCAVGPGLDCVAVACVVDALYGDVCRRGEGVATINGVRPVRFFAAQIRNGRLHDDVRIVRDAEVSPVVNLAVLRDFGGGERVVVLAEVLHRPDERVGGISFAISAKAKSGFRKADRIIVPAARAGRRLRRAVEKLLRVVVPRDCSYVVINAACHVCPRRWSFRGLDFPKQGSVRFL